MEPMLSFLFAMVVFGTIGLFVRYAPLPSSLIALTRGIIGTLFLLVWAHLGHISVEQKTLRDNWKHLVASGIAIGINWILLFESYRHTSLAVATLCYYLQPVFVTLLAPMVLREKLRPCNFLLIVLTFLGMSMVCGLTRPQGPLGILLASGAALFYASVILINKKMGAIEPILSTAIQLGIASLSVLPYVLLTVDFPTVAFTRLGITILLVIGIVHTGFAYALYFGAMQKLSAHMVAILSYIDPITALMLSALVLKETMTTTQFIGAVVVLGSTLAGKLIEDAG